MAPSGASLQEQKSKVPGRLQAVSAVNEKIVWASGTGGSFTVTTNGGASWRSGVVAGADSLEFRDVHGVDEKTAYLLSAGNGTASRIYKTTDAGQNWQLQFINRDSTAFYDCFAFWDPLAGIAFSDSVGYDLPNGDSLIPDASFVSREQIWFPLPDDNFTFAPLVAVEVASPSNSSRDLYDKAESFLECGTKVVWIAYLGRQIVDVCHRSADGKLVVEKLGLNAAISGENVLPGFSLPVKDVFPPQE